MPMYSHSKISTFEQCPKKFKFRYIDKIKPLVEKSIESYLGSSVHNALEWFYTKIKDGTTPSLDELILKYTTEWQNNFKENFVIVKQNLTAKDYFNKGVEFLVGYYMQNQPFDDNTLEVEKKIIIELDENGKYKIQGYIDRLAYNLKSKEYEVHDYKTANSLPSKEKIKNDRQLALYSIAVKEIFGKEKRVSLIWHYLAHNKKIILKKTNEELELLKKHTLESIKKIENTKEFPPNKSILCGWCEYKTICPAWGNSPPKDISKPKKLSAQKKFQSPLENKNSDIDKYPTLKKYFRD